MTNAADAWDPTTYRRFADERRLPFHDLLAMIRERPIGTAVDLGCGPGELTRLAADELGCSSMVGIDNSAAMLASTAEHAGRGVTFRFGDIGSFTSDANHDLVLASASLQWVPDHAAVLGSWSAALRPGGQLAVQVPANAHMPLHTIAVEVANTEPFLSAFGSEGPPPDPVARNVLEPEAYASILFDLGFADQHVRLQVYPHVLAGSRSIVDWVRGTLLTRFQRSLPADLFEAFVAAYEQRLIEVVGERSPCFFPFRRILFWARLAR